MRRVAVTGMGIVSSIGGDTGEVAASLRDARSGIVAAPEYAELGFRCQVHAAPTIDWETMIDRRAARFLAAGAGYAHIAMEQAIADAGLTDSEVSNDRTGLIVGAGGPSTRTIVEAAETARTRGVKRIGPFAVPKAMSSGPSATLATWFKIRGQNFSISSACATSTHCIGAACEQIQLGKQDLMFAGGCEELDWTLSALFDAMGAMSSGFNDTPARASRPYDIGRDGFVIAGGAGMVVLEDLERAKARGATIHAEIVGHGANSDGFDMVAPSGEGAARCMRLAIEAAGGRTIDYLNPHGTGTPIGDVKEMGAVRDVFGATVPLISSTKALTGPQSGGGRRAGGDLLPADDARRVRGQKRPYRCLDPAFADLRDRARAHRAAAHDGDVQQLRLRWHQRLPGAEPRRPLKPPSFQTETDPPPWPTISNSPRATLMAGKRGVVMGVANHKSIAWGIAAQLAAQGAQVALGYMEANEKRVRPLGESIGASVYATIDAASDASMEAAFKVVEDAWGSIDFLVHAIAYADRSQIKGSFVENATREAFAQALDISAYSFVDASRRAARLMPAGGSIVTLTYLGSERDPQLQHHGRGQGGARSVDALCGARSRTQGDPRQRHFGRSEAHAVAGRNFGRTRHAGPGSATERHEGGHAHGGRRGLRAVAALGSRPLDHRRGGARRCRLPHDGPGRRGRGVNSQ